MHAFAGLRVLPRGPGDTARASREHLVEVAPSGLVSIAGGKLTTHRSLAALALRALGQTAGPRTRARPVEPLAGAVEPLAETRQLVRLRPQLDAATLAHLVHLYGGFARNVLALGDDLPDLLEPVDPRGPDLAAQVVYAATHEWALDPDDVVLRRTTVAIRGLDSEAVRAHVEQLAGLRPPVDARARRPPGATN